MKREGENRPVRLKEPEDRHLPKCRTGASVADHTDLHDSLDVTKPAHAYLGLPDALKEHSDPSSRQTSDDRR